MATIKINGVETEYVKKGKNGWHQATVNYVDEGNGKEFSKKLMSFKNPKVFGVIQDAKTGQRFNVEVKKEGDFYEWVAIEAAGAAPAAKGAPAAATTKGGWETPEERAAKQVYIVKQSSIGAAVALMGVGASVESVLDAAQRFVDFVFDNDTSSVDSEVLDD